ncbi:hypothetical protein FACS1894204_02710 [Synergistales bacterium]|nr:hypothetical protein FACS1894204_02710 [Synergistales bacterium]
MQFDFVFLRETRLKNKIGCSAFAVLLGISVDYLYRFESGRRKPNIKIVGKMAHLFGVSIEAFYIGGVESKRVIIAPDTTMNLLAVTNSLNRERYMRKMADERIFELEKLTEHLLCVNALYVQFSDILRLGLPKPVMAKKIAALARTTARAGDICFNEIQVILCLTQATLTHYLETEVVSYSCRMSKEKTVMTSNPGEAGMRLLCFDCEARAKEICGGYGENNQPESIFTLIAMLEANGICNREDQSKELSKSCNTEMSAHQISDLLSRKKHGKPIPEYTENMDIRGRA